MREILPASDTNVNKKRAIRLDVATAPIVSSPRRHISILATTQPTVIFSVISIIVMYITYILLIIKHFISHDFYDCHGLNFIMDCKHYCKHYCPHVHK